MRFTSNQPYATLHNEGGKGSVTVRKHQRKRKGNTHNVRQHMRKVNMPQRQFVGDGQDTQRIIKNVIDDNLEQYNQEIIKALKK